MEKKAKKQAEEKAFVQHSGRLIFNTLLNGYSTTLPENTCQWANFQKSSATKDQDVARVKIQREKQLRFTTSTPVCPALKSR